MKIIKKYKLSKLAEEDLLDIFQNGIDYFGKTKAQQYSLTIEKTFRRLESFPNIGKPRDELFPGALSFPVGSHIVFYRKTPDGIEVARVLHKRMDYGQYFDS